MTSSSRARSVATLSAPRLLYFFALLLPVILLPAPAVAQTAHYAAQYSPDFVYASATCSNEYGGQALAGAVFDYSTMTFDITVYWYVDCIVPGPILLWESDFTYSFQGTFTGDATNGITISGDGCSEVCAVEPGFRCSGEPSFCAAEVLGLGALGMGLLALGLAGAGGMMPRVRGVTFRS